MPLKNKIRCEFKEKFPRSLLICLNKVEKRIFSLNNRILFVCLAKIRFFYKIKLTCVHYCNNKGLIFIFVFSK